MHKNLLNKSLTSITLGGTIMYNHQREKMTITPNHIFFETSDPLTEEQIEKLNFFVNELLFDGDDLESIPEFTTEFTQVNFNNTN